MGIFVTLKNVDRFPGLVFRVKGCGDEIEISYEPLVKPVPTMPNTSTNQISSPNAAAKPIEDS